MQGIDQSTSSSATVVPTSPLTQPSQMASSVTPTPSSSLKYFFIIGGILLIGGVAFGGWKYQQMKNLLAESLVKTVDTSIVATTTQEVSQTEVATSINSIILASSSTAILSTNQVKSEIDAYGVDLYQLKQGETIKEIISPKKMKVVYVRKLDSIERTVSYSDNDTSGGVLEKSQTIDLRMKENLPESIKEIENKITVSCAKGLTKECLNEKAFLDFVKGKCVNLVKNEEIGTCFFEGAMTTLFAK